MGNCSLKAAGDATKGFNFARIMTDSGEILQLRGPKLVQEVIDEFPGYRIFGQGHISSPLLNHEQLLNGKLYYLLPLDGERFSQSIEDSRELDARSSSEPLRMSSSSGTATELVTGLANGSALEVLPPPRKGVWRVKLVINPKQLGEILSEEENTEALIEQMRMVANSAASPKHTKNSWGVNWKTSLSSVFKMPLENQKRAEALEVCRRSPKIKRNIAAMIGRHRD